MRMTAEVLNLANELNFNGKLIDGEDFELQMQPMSMKCRDFVDKTYSSLKNEPKSSMHHKET